ncbi:hypothetical protein [Emticicia fluvialis]|nr:hypothetical protein [Emticicia fluvialis]
MIKASKWCQIDTKYFTPTIGNVAERSAGITFGFLHGVSEA